jgi:hypothetical protein
MLEEKKYEGHIHGHNEASEGGILTSVSVRVFLRISRLHRYAIACAEETEQDSGTADEEQEDTLR